MPTASTENETSVHSGLNFTGHALPWYGRESAEAGLGRNQSADGVELSFEVFFGYRRLVTCKTRTRLLSADAGGVDPDRGFQRS